MWLCVGVVLALTLSGCKSEDPQPAPTARTVAPSDAAADASPNVADGGAEQHDASVGSDGVHLVDPEGPVAILPGNSPATPDEELQGWVQRADAVAVVHVATFYAVSVDGPPFAQTVIFFAMDTPLRGVPPPSIIIDGGALPSGDVIAPHSPHFELNSEYLLITNGGGVIAAPALFPDGTVNAHGDHIPMSRILTIVASGAVQ